MNHANVEKLRDRLRDTVPDEKFDMRDYIRGAPSDQETPAAALKHCGTAACVAGWTAALFLRRRIELFWEWGGEEFDRAAQRVLGLTDNQADDLFYPDGYNTGAKYTRDMAVETLTRLLETGEVDWGPQ